MGRSQAFMSKLVFVPKAELDRRLAQEQKRKANGGKKLRPTSCLLIQASQSEPRNYALDNLDNLSHRVVDVQHHS